MHRKKCCKLPGGFLQRLLDPTGPFPPVLTPVLYDLPCCTVPADPVMLSESSPWQRSAVSSGTGRHPASRQGWPGSRCIRCIEDNFSVSFSMGKLEAQSCSPEEVKECLKKKEITKLYILKIIGDMVNVSHATDVHGQAASHLGTLRE